MSSVFQLYILGKLSAEASEQTLTIMAEFLSGRAIDRVNISKTELAQLTETIRSLRVFIEAGFPTFDESTLEDLGARLFKLIINNKVRRLFNTAIGFRDNDLIPLEIILEDYELASWPWEYLYDLENSSFICQGFFPISRGIFYPEPIKVIRPQQDKKNILIVIGALDNDLEARPDEEIAWIKKIFDDKLVRDIADLNILQAVKPIELDLALQKKKYDIVHFFGHAGFDYGKNKGYLKLDNLVTPYKFYADDFAELLMESGIQLVFLNACKTAVSGIQTDPIRSAIAAAILSRGIPAVIATQFSIPDASAHILASRIYNSVIVGKSLSAALRDGRRAMLYTNEQQFFDWGIPILYTSDPQQIIFPRFIQTETINVGKQTDKILALNSNNLESTPPPSKIDDTDINEASGEIIEKQRKNEKATYKVKVSLVDIDSKVAFLSELAKAANEAQDYYYFQVSYIPMPSGTLRSNFGNKETKLQMYLPWLDKYLSDLPGELKVDIVCCLTNHMVAFEENGILYWNYFSCSLSSNDKVFVLSTYNMRSYARKANVPISKAVLAMSLSMIIAIDSNWEIDYHKKTYGCLFDFCENREDIVIGLKNMKFAHKSCRKKIKNKKQLEAIDKLLAINLSV